MNRQSKQAKVQQDQIDQLKRIAVQYQVCPAVQFCKCYFIAYHNPNKIQMVRREVRKQFIAQYGVEEWNKEVHQKGTNFVVLTFGLNYQGMIPITECQIEKLEWKIADKKYEIQLIADKKRLIAKNELTIVIEEQDICLEERRQFFEDTALFCVYSTHKVRKYQESELTVQILFSNEASKRRRYSVSYWFDAADSKSNHAGRMECMIEPYVRMEETDDEG